MASKNTLRYAELLRVPVPKIKAPTYNPAVPATWNNEQLREWIEKNVTVYPPFHLKLYIPPR